MQFRYTTKGWKFEFWLPVTIMCKKHLANMHINALLGLLVPEDGGIMLLWNIGYCYHMMQNNSPEDLNCHQHLCEGFSSRIQVVVMYLSGCFSAPTEWILLKIHILGSAHIHFRWHKFGCDWSVYKVTSLKEQFTFSTLEDDWKV